jgi:hypothetical protein
MPKLFSLKGDKFENEASQDIQNLGMDFGK